MHIRKGFYDINMRQIELMAHTLGFDRKKIKYNKHECVRNHFVIHKIDGKRDRIELDDLVGKGMMKSTTNGEQITYNVVEWGFMLFGEIYNCKVFEME